MRNSMGKAAARWMAAMISGRKKIISTWLQMVARTSAALMPTCCRIRKRLRSSYPSLSCL